jgi:uncharacterized membrane protein
MMMSQKRAKPRDEILAQHHHEETRKIDQPEHDLTEKARQPTRQLCNAAG